MATDKSNLTKNRKFYFIDSSFQLGSFGYKVANLVFNIWLVLLVVGGAIALLSELSSIRALGALIFLYLGDWLVHRGRARYALRQMPKTGDVNLAWYLAPQVLSLIVEARDRTMVLGGNFYLRLAHELLKTGGVEEALRRLDVPTLELQAKLDEYLKESGEVKSSDEEIMIDVLGLLILALDQANLGQGNNITAPDLFAALGVLGDKSLIKLFDLFEIDPGDLEKALIFGRFRKKLRWLNRLPSSLGGFGSQSYGLTHRFMNRAWTARPTPALDRFSNDLTDMARASKTGFLIGHANEYRELLDILSRPNRPNAILVGEAGAGKGTIVGHLAYMIIQDQVPRPLFDKRVVELDLSALLSGADQGELQGRIKLIFDEITRAQNIILYIPDIQNLSRTADRTGLSAAHILVPIISSNDFPVIGSTYPREYKQFIQGDSSFAEAFQAIRIEEITPDEAELILAYDSLLLENIYKVDVTFAAIKVAVDLARKYFHQKLLPLSADELLKEALSNASHTGKKRLTGDDVIEIAERRVNVPLRRAGEKEAEKLLGLEKIIHENLVDQEPAVSIVSRALREYRSGLSRKGGPIGAFLFVGPTGVGKTELSKILARIQFGSEEAMVRFDMSEYQEKQSLARFIGSSDGTVSGSLTDAILEKPYGLVLLDEFEKAHPDILNLFLQVFDDGRLTDALGRLVNFQNTIIIATSNAHSDFIKSSLEAGQTMEDISLELKKKLTQYFRPELLNRFSSIVVFKALGLDDVIAISRLQLNGLAKTLKESKDLEIGFTDEVVKKIAELGYDPAFGARPLREVISEKLRGPLSERMLKKEIGEGSTVSVSLSGETLEFKVS